MIIHFDSIDPYYFKSRRYRICCSVGLSVQQLQLHEYWCPGSEVFVCLKSVNADFLSNLARSKGPGSRPGCEIFFWSHFSVNLGS